MEMPAPNSTDATKSSIEINGVQIGLQEWGRPTSTTAATEEKRPVLVLLHGFTGSTDSWRTQGETFAHRGFHVIALDMLGHGRSSAPDEPQRYAIEHCRTDILAALQQSGIHAGEAILLGYSMGGRIALHTALSGYFRALILESATPGLSTEQEREQRMRSDEALASCIEQYGVESFMDYWERRPLFSTQLAMPLRLRQQLRQQRLQNNVTGLSNSLRGDQLSALTIPVLLITGSEDSKFTKIAEEMLPLLPQAQHTIVPESGHTVHFEQSEAFATIVYKFCQSLS
jgi:2-succinyl-6-hydroxy-2,4-cyclohexadiene-1-carboxylate synthase